MSCMERVITPAPGARRTFAALLWLAAVALSPGRLTAQEQEVEAPGAQEADTPAVPAETAEPLPETAPAPGPTAPEVPSLTQTLVLPNGTPVAGASVILRSLADGASTEVRSVSTNRAGVAVFSPLTPGFYEVQIRFPGAAALHERIEVDGAETIQTVVAARGSREPSTEQTLWTIACLLLFFASIVLVRWHNIARSVHALMYRQVEALRTRLETEVVEFQTDAQGGPVDAEGRAIMRLRASVDELKESLKDKEHGVGWSEFFFWSRGRENATWVGIHEVERQVAAFLSPAEYVEAYLRSVQADLRAINKPGAMAVADAIHEVLKTPVPATGGESALRTRKVLLGRGLAIVYSERDSSFSTLMEWQNKANWLILAALIAIGFLVAAAGNAVIFLAGATGGFLSRLMRAINRDDVPLDYGASWTTLFLSPLLGALAGWFGIAIIDLLADPELNLLGDAFQRVSWADPLSPATLAIAFLLGFSERLFDAIVGAVEGHAIRKEEARNEAARDLARGGNDAGGAAQAGGASGAGGATGGPLAVTSVARQSVADGHSADALIVTGRGFVTGATARVNDLPRTATVDSATQITLPLTPDDVQLLGVGGDFMIVIANPDGAISQPHNVSEAS